MRDNLPMDVLIRDRYGKVHALPEKWATLLAEDMRRLPLYSPDASQTAADKIEARLVGAEDDPVEFNDDEAIEVLKGLTAIVVGWNTPEARALYDGFAAPDPRAS
jgi:hypothetical protein